LDEHATRLRHNSDATDFFRIASCLYSFENERNNYCYRALLAISGTDT
jgi:hypothetical protein